MSGLHHSSSRDHLLGPSATSTAPSFRSSRPASVYSTASIDTLVAANPHPAEPEDQTYRGYPSKEAYLAALREWVDSKLYFESDVQLRGWYGTKTKEEYLAKTSIWEERRERKREEKMERERQQRRATVSRLGAVPEDGEHRPEEDLDAGEVKEAKKESKLRRVFGRRNTVV